MQTGPAHERRVRLLQILTCDDIGGTELMVTMLAQRLDQGRFAIEVVFLDSAGPIAARLRGAGITSYSLGGEGWPATIWRLSSLVRRRHYDVIHAYGFRGPFVVRFLAGILSPRARVISGIQGLHAAEVEDVDGLRARLILAADRATASLIDVYEVNSLGALDFLVRRGFPQRENTIYRTRSMPPCGQFGASDKAAYFPPSSTYRDLSGASGKRLGAGCRRAEKSDDVPVRTGG